MCLLATVLDEDVHTCVGFGCRCASLCRFCMKMCIVVSAFVIMLIIASKFAWLCFRNYSTWLARPGGGPMRGAENVGRFTLKNKGVRGVGRK